MNLAGISFSLGLVTVMTLLVGLIKNKVWAVYLGPYGVGLISQLCNFQLLLSLLASFGMGQGITKYIAEYDQVGDTQGAETVLNAAVIFSLLLSLLLVVVTIAFASPISHLVLGDGVLYLLMIIVSLGVPFQVVGETCLAFLQGQHRINRIVRANLFISALTLLSAIPMIIFFRLAGAATHIALTSIITCCAFLWQSGKLPLQIRGLFSAKHIAVLIRSALLKKLINFGVLRLVQISAGSIAILIVRSLVIRYQGAFQNGIYQAATNFSVFFIPIILNMLCSYFFPAFCKARNNYTLTVEVNRCLHYSLLIVLPATVFILLLRYPLIRLVYASSFKSVALILPLQLLGDFVRVMAMPLGSAMVSREMLAAGVKCELVWNILFIISAFLFLPHYNIAFLLVAYIFSYILNFIMLYMHMCSVDNFKITFRNWVIIVISVLLILMAGVVPLRSVNFVIFIALAMVWICFALPVKSIIYCIPRRERGDI